jgi:hypothetical protein
VSCREDGACPLPGMAGLLLYCLDLPTNGGHPVKAGSLRERNLLAGWLYGAACRTAAHARATAARRREREALARIIHALCWYRREMEHKAIPCQGFHPDSIAGCPQQTASEKGAAVSRPAMTVPSAPCWRERSPCTKSAGERLPGSDSEQPRRKGLFGSVSSFGTTESASASDVNPDEQDTKDLDTRVNEASRESTFLMTRGGMSEDSALTERSSSSIALPADRPSDESLGRRCSASHACCRHAIVPSTLSGEVSARADAYPVRRCRTHLLPVSPTCVGGTDLTAQGAPKSVSRGRFATVRSSRE